MFDDDHDPVGPFELPAASSLGVLIQILAADGKVTTIHDLVDYFSDGIHDLIWAVNDLHLLDLIDLTEVEVDGVATARIQITFRGHAFLSSYAWQLIENYQSYFRKHS
ncbi:MAG: hypothetical protein FGM47_06570 [Candidatus Nanopelagicaceae bacterium]|nr:hypothetical protein [Candidatus Nanopelagicaceae bacterium]